MPTVSTLVVEVEAKTSKFSSGAKTAVAALGGLTVAGAYCFNQFEESNKVAEQTNAVLKSTGGAANVTADQISGLATSLSNKSGVDDEAIQSGENMLLTFKNIRNEAGANNDIFNQAASTTLDMAAGMAAASGGAVDMKSASIQLGKALNDPIAGISALSRIGVTFTEQQKAQIKTMVDSGNTLGAQKVILQEVNSEFAGSAAAGKTSMASMQVAVGNLAESIGGVLAPAINVVVNALTAFIGFLTRFPAAFVAVGLAVAAVTVALVANNIQTALAAEEGIVFAAVTVAKTTAMIASTAAVYAATAAQWLWNAALTANPIGLIVVAIAAAIAIIVILVKHFHLADNIMNVLKATVGVVWGFIKTTVGVVVKLVVGYIKLWIAAVGLIVKAILGVSGVVGRAFQTAYNFVVLWLGKAANVVRSVWDGIIKFISGLGARMARGARNIWTWLGDLFKLQVNIVLGAFNFLIAELNKLQVHIHLDPPGPGQINFDWSGLNLPSLPTLQSGGVVMRTGMALVHEGERYSGVGGSGWGGTVNVYVSGSVIAEHDLAETVQKALLKSKRRSGALGLS